MTWGRAHTWLTGLPHVPGRLDPLAVTLAVCWAAWWGVVALFVVRWLLP